MIGKRKFITILTTLSFFLIVFADCASVAPIPPKDYDRLVRDRVNLKKNDSIIFSDSFEWLPRTYGYEKTMQLKIDKTFYKGILACTEECLYFIAMIGNTYVPRLKMDYTDIVSVDLHKYGLGRRLIIQNKDYDTHTFQGLSASGYSVDKQKTENAYKIIKQKCRR